MFDVNFSKLWKAWLDNINAYYSASYSWIKKQKEFKKY